MDGEIHTPGNPYAMSLVMRLIDFVADAIGSSGRLPGSEGDERLAAAALLVHVARVDGRWTPVERERLLDLVRSRFGLSAEAAERFLDRADAVDREADDIATLIEMMGHGISPDERRSLLAMAYAVAAADGRTHEFEDDLVWRVGRLLGFDDAQILKIREGAVSTPGIPA